MYSTKKALAATIVAALVFSCGNAMLKKRLRSGEARDHIIKKAAWLIGEWENKGGRRTMYENWVIKNDSTFWGKSYFLKEKDTVIMENVSLEQRNNELFYIPVVNGQNNNEPVSFKMVFITSTQLVFENPAHDFPQKILYTQITKDSLLAEISGVVNGTERSRKFPMKKIR